MHLLPLLLACAGSSADTSGDAPTDVPTHTTVLVYMAGDNDLESYVMHDLHELDGGGSGEGVRVLVQADRAEGYATDGGDWTGTRRYEIFGDEDDKKLNARLVEDMGEQDMGVPETLEGFLAWGMEYAPSERIALFLWNHGDGWSFAPPPPPSIASDDESGNVLSIAEGDLQAGLEAAVAERGPLELIGFDACYMATFEVAHALSPYAETMLAAEPWVGWDGIMYGPLLKEMRARPEADLRELAKGAASLSVAEGGERSFSVVALEEAQATAEALDALAGEALGSPEAMEALLEARRLADTAEPYWPNFYLDLGSLAEQAELQGLSTAGPLREAMGPAVPHLAGTEDWSWLSGLSIMADVREPTMLRLYSEGEGASWSQETRWDEVLLAIGEM